MIIVVLAAVLALGWVLVPPPPTAAPPVTRGQERREQARMLEVARMVERLAAVISTGSSMPGAWDAVARSLPTGDLADLARAVAAGADPRRAAARSIPSSEVIGSLGAALAVCERTGAPTAGVLESLAEALRELHDAALARRNAFTGPRSTARILLVLPLAGLGMGALLGGDPLRLLLTTPVGNLLAVIGILLTSLGWWWMHRLVRIADPPPVGQVDPSVVLELVAGALETGSPLARAVEAVSEALDEGPDAHALAHLASALEAGVPAEVAAQQLPPVLAPLAESAVLSESTGADLARVLRSAARDARRDRARQAEEHAARLAVRLVLPTGAALLPAFVVLGIIPTVMSLLGGALALPGAGGGSP